MFWAVWDIVEAFSTLFRHQNGLINTKFYQIHVQTMWFVAFLLLWITVVFKAFVSNFVYYILYYVKLTGKVITRP